MEIASKRSFQHKGNHVHKDDLPQPSFVEALIDPMSLFDHPHDVVDHPWFTREEKRTILLSWARDELVAEQVTSRLSPELQIRSRIDAVVDALATFDRGAASEYNAAVSSVRAQPVNCSRRRG